MSIDFKDFHNTFFFADKVASFNGAEGKGKISWKRTSLYTRQAFNVNTILPQDLKMLDFPGEAYEQNPELDFSVDFVTPRTLRIRMLTTPVQPKPFDSPMLVKEPGKDSSWKYSKTGNTHTYKSNYGSIEIEENPFRITLKDEKGKRLTDTWRWCDNDSSQVKVIPFNFIKRGLDNSRAINPVFSLSPGEKIFGCGESVTKLDKRGQKVNLFVTDPQGPETDQMYKPVPFFMSNRGYGMFMHTSAPVTCDFGNTYVGANKLFMGDEALDLFIFIGEPKDILNEYTEIVGKPSMPPLWSFGTWMSRITYFEQSEGYDVAAKLRSYKIPSDVIHFDTGWFETDWQCDYKFAPSRFSNPQKMIDDLKKDGFHISLWQLTYFTPKNKFFNEIIEKNLHVKNSKGEMPYEDAVLDFSNLETVKWYQDKLAGLLKMGVGAIKVDFGEAAPIEGFYASGRGGWYEHNLYPLRYNKAVADITKEVNNENIIWARSAWAGSQRYPLHWGGDAANTDIGMDATLRGGLSFGLSGFSFWSHDIGGFVVAAPENLYRRWLPFGFLTSHSRAHGAPPKEPWLYNDNFVKAFRESAEMKYKLMPYIYAQAKLCTEKGLPMVRALFVEYPDDPGAWLVEDQYLFGTDILVAPMMEAGTERNVYLPKGNWIDYQSGKTYQQGWNVVEAGKIPAIILVREGAVIPHAQLAQSTDKINWSDIELKVYGDKEKATGFVCLPSDNKLTDIILTKSGSNYQLEKGQIQGVHYRINK
ncbi:alpha-xylosidase [Dysgonomonas mossii]|uniref:Alpha-xylosidase n=1 Tax=Dysgonomonas mossii TaxID=163665 RepID=A0A4Y9ITF6_9BACT|nr:alpha-xylosidase [Dysgonomonas mossii]MBF0759877.1 alpha-xylosidase [Dysgonomonas mossii]TFU91446.1 alpha-xylosidase [Dysgonomonas mossii]